MTEKSRYRWQVTGWSAAIIGYYGFLIMMMLGVFDR